MYSNHLFIATMNTFKCSAIEAQAFLNLDINKAMIFSSGEVHIPPNWTQNQAEI